MKNEFKMIWDIDTSKGGNIPTVVGKTVRLLNSLLEGNIEKNYINLISESLNIDFIMSIVQEELVEFARRKKPELSFESFCTNYRQFADKSFFDESLIETFKTYFFVQLILEEGQNYKFTSNNTLPTKLTNQFFQENSRRVEIVFRDGIEKIYFPVHPACQYLPKMMKAEFLKKFSRETQNEKMV